MKMLSIYIRNWITKYRGILSKHLIQFFLRHRYNNKALLHIFYFFFSLLERGRYVSGHNDALHHYIPKFILRKFAIPGTNGGQIFGYSKTGTSARMSVAREVACESNLYTFTEKDDKQRSSFIENQMFARMVEKYGSQILFRLWEYEDTDLTYLEGSILAILVGYQLVRTPLFMEQIRLVLSFLHQERGVPVEDMVRQTFYRRAFIENEYNITIEDFERFIQAPGARFITGGNTKNIQLTIMSQLGNYLSEVIYRKRLFLTRALVGTNFFMPDCGAVAFNSQVQQAMTPFLWNIKDRMGIIILPISPQLCVQYSNHPGLLMPPGLINSYLALNVKTFAFSGELTNPFS